MAENWYKLIEDYNLGKLPESRRAQFETAMADDPALAQAVQEHRTEWEAGELLTEQILRSQIREAFETYPGNTGTWLSKYWKWILASTFILITTAVLVLKTRQPVAPKQELLPAPPLKIDPVAPKVPIAQVPPDSKSTTPPQTQLPSSEKTSDYKALALAAYRTPDGLANVRGTAGSGDSLELAQQAFEKKDLRLALSYLSSLPTDSRQEGLALRGHVYFLSGNYAAASADFSELQEGGVYTRDAQWFGLLSDMTRSAGNKNNILQRLDAIRRDKHHPWQKDAAALWERLKE